MRKLQNESAYLLTGAVKRSEIFYRTIRRQMKGTGITRITLQQIAPIFIPLPPLAEQKLIVAKLDELLPQIDGLK